MSGIMDLSQGSITKCRPQSLTLQLLHALYSMESQERNMIRFTVHLWRELKKKKNVNYRKRKMHVIACVCISIFTYINIYLFFYFTVDNPEKKYHFNTSKLLCYLDPQALSFLNSTQLHEKIRKLCDK